MRKRAVPCCTGRRSFLSDRHCVGWLRMSGISRPFNFRRSESGATRPHTSDLQRASRSARHSAEQFCESRTPPGSCYCIPLYRLVKRSSQPPPPTSSAPRILVLAYCTSSTRRTGRPRLKTQKRNELGEGRKEGGLFTIEIAEEDVLVTPRFI